MTKEVLEYSNEADLAEREIKQLQDQINNLENCINSNSPACASDPDVVKLVSENTKLKHRLTILNRAIESYKTSQSTMAAMQSISEPLHELFASAISAAFPDLVDVPVVIALSGNNPKFGDYQCNSPLRISNIFKQAGEIVAPREIAEKIKEKVPSHAMIEKLEVAGPGFINIYINKRYGQDEIKKILLHGVQPPPLEKKLRVLVDFSSPNIAKEMHVGHLRSTIIGDSIARLLEFLGHDVLRINHLGDWGTPFGMLIAHLQDKCPDYVTNSPPISDLQMFYKEAKKRFDESKEFKEKAMFCKEAKKRFDEGEEFKKRTYACVVKLQSLDPDYKKAWEMICNVSRKEFQKIYDRLDIKLIERGESFYQSRMEKIVKELEEKGFLKEDKGCKVLWGEECKVMRGDREQIPMIIVKSDGAFTYDTSDFATIKQRIEEEKSDWIIYVIDAGQAQHMQLLFNCAEKVGILDRSKVRVDHVAFGVVKGEDKKKFKTRSGETVRLLDLLDEGLKRAEEKLKEKGRDAVLTPEEFKQAQESVAYGCIKYADLSHNYTHDYEFSFDRMLEDKGNTAVYLLYAYTRIRSIARGCNFTSDMIKEYAESCPVSLDHDKEWKLGKVLLRFPDVLLKITSDFCLHHLCEYVYEIATAFSEFYESCYCIEKDSSGSIVKVFHSRILLAEATTAVMGKCFDILGLKPVSKM